MDERRTPGDANGMTTMDLWSFRTDPAAGDIDLTGYSVEAIDGSFGKVDEVFLDPGGSYVVVDTGLWVFGKKVMLPAGLVDRIEPEHETVLVNLTRDELKGAPELDLDAVWGDVSYRHRLGDYFGGLRR